MRFVQWLKYLITGNSHYKDNDFIGVSMEEKDFPIPTPAGYRTGDDTVGLTFNPKPLFRKDVNYTLNGPTKNLWLPRKTIDGTYSCKFSGLLTYPEEWKGYYCRLKLNSNGSSISYALVDRWMGSGHCCVEGLGENSVDISITIPPAMAKDIIEHALYWEKEVDDKDKKFSIRVVVENLTQGHVATSKERPAIYFRVMNIYLRQSEGELKKPGFLFI